MKELVKPNPIEQEFNEVDAYCDGNCNESLTTGCACRRRPNSLENEDDIIF